MGACARLLGALETGSYQSAELLATRQVTGSLATVPISICLDGQPVPKPAPRFHALEVSWLHRGPLTEVMPCVARPRPNSREGGRPWGSGPQTEEPRRRHRLYSDSGPERTGLEVGSRKGRGERRPGGSVSQGHAHDVWGWPAPCPGVLHTAPGHERPPRDLPGPRDGGRHCPPP